ncbi:MAG: polysaccharide biosynthesis protein PslG [Actinomycetota bacterium]|jgi:hypothetical protein|nr:polysaccharide biosynthesis protein PslG [Actinomycetota bacterium]
MQLLHRVPLPVRLLTVGLSLLLAAAVLPSAPAQAAAKPRGIAVSKYFFGMHDNDPTSWPVARVGSIRLWDSGVTWRDIEAAPGQYDWARLDAQVASARVRGAEVTLVLGQTPQFYARGTTSAPEFVATGATRPPDIAAWRAYVHAVADRYAGRISALQVWNEANVIGFWSGSVGQLAELTYWARYELTGVNRTHGSKMQLVSPGFVARSNVGVVSAYWAQSFNGVRMGSLVDKVALSLYPSPAGTPEDTITRLAAVKRILSRYKVTKPIWNTEVNFGLIGGGNTPTPTHISPERQAAYVVRTYLLNASSGIERVFWYRWDLTSIANTVLSINGSPTLAGRAYGLTQSWLAGARLQGCPRAAKGALKGTYVCTLSVRGGVNRIYWNPSRSAKVTLPATASYSINLYGKKTRAKGGSKKIVDYRPVLVHAKR